jgi:hypothetical protein
MLPKSGVRAESRAVNGNAVDGSALDDDPVPLTAPLPFRAAVMTLLATTPRPEARVERIRPPQRLAPWSFAVAVDVTGDRDADESATGRLVVLYDPDGLDAWDGEMRLVAYAQADLAPDMAGDPLLPAVGWSWLVESLVSREAPHVAAGGTITQTTSTRFGDVHGPSSTTQLELRGSWTATTTDLAPHLLAFVDVLCAAAGLPPEGVAVLGDR